MRNKQLMQRDRPVMYRIASGIVSLRYVIFAVFALVAVYCVLSIGRVRVNSDITAFLPQNTETRRGLSVMEEEFTTYGTARVMVNDIDIDRAEGLADELRAVEHVAQVTFDHTENHYKDRAALYDISMDAPGRDSGAAAGLEGVREVLTDVDSYIVSEIGEGYSAKIAGEMGLVLALAAAVIIGVLLFSSRSYFEVLIYLIVFIVAAVMNMGTNFWLGEISSITNTVAVILQLALAIDYAIIFAHRYQDEAAACADDREAVTRALAKSIVEIASSALTTISGLVALTLMQMRLGYDLGVVLAKGIVCSMLTVFLLMPGLLLLCARPVLRLNHRPLVPSIEGWGRLLMKKVPVFLILFALILPFAIIGSSKTEYAFHDSTVTEIVYSEEREGMHRISETFDPGTAVAVIVPAGEYEKEKHILGQIGQLDGVTGATGLAGVEIAPGITLTDSVTAGEVADFLHVDVSQVKQLFLGYALSHGDYQAMNGDETYAVPLVDIALFLFDVIDQGMFVPTDAQQELLDELRPQLERGVAQLRGEHYDRLVVTSSLPAEGEESVALIERMRLIAEAQYGEGTVLVTGAITSARDLRETYKSDSVLITLLTIVFVYMILLVTFRSPVTAAILVFVIQGSIWINFAIPYLCGMVGSFVTHMIVSAIQMGATIDYAIVIMNRYRALRQQFEKREAMVKAVNESFPTVITSGAIMAVAGFLIGYLVSDVYVNHIGHAVGRGALISMAMVLTVLPQLVVLCDTLIEKTTLRFKKKA